MRSRLAHFILSLSTDIFFIGVLSILSFLFISFYKDAVSINTGYPDWLVHAFRVKFLETNGFISWSHIWANGANILQSYQFIPHVLTIAASKLLHVSITRAMVILIVSQFIALRIFIYIALRMFKIQAVPALVASILSFAIAQYWGGISDYSIIFGITCFPIMILLWIWQIQHRLLFVYMALCGLCFYIHPILAFYAVMLWVIGLFSTNRSIISLHTITEVLVFLLCSSLFWVPLVMKDSYAYTAPALSTLDFLKHPLADYANLGLSLSIMVAFVLSLVHIMLPNRRQFHWSYLLTIFAFTMLFLVWVQTTLNLPLFINRFQFTRGMSFIGIAIVFACSPMIERIYKKKNIILSGLLIAGAIFILSESVWFSSVYSNPPTKTIDDPVSSYIKIHPSTPLRDGRIWVPMIDASSFQAPLTMRFPYSYMGHMEPNLVSPRIVPLVSYERYQSKIPDLNMERINDYFKITGTKYVFADEYSSLTRTLLSPKSGYKDLGSIELTSSAFHLFEVPWSIINATIVDPTYIKYFNTFPSSLASATINDQIALDSNTKILVGALYQNANTPLSVSYPTPETLTIQFPANRKSNFIYINESYSKNWKATVDGVPQKITMAGPHFMAVSLTIDQQKSGELLLRHSWPISFYASIVLIIMCSIILIVINIIEHASKYRFSFTL